MEKINLALYHMLNSSIPIMKKHKNEYHNLKDNLFIFNVEYHKEEDTGLEITDLIHIKANKEIKNDFAFDIKLKIENDNFLDYIVDIEFTDNLGEIRKEYDEGMKDILSFLGSEIHKDIYSKLNLYIDIDLDFLKDSNKTTFNNLMKKIHENNLLGFESAHKIRKAHMFPMMSENEGLELIDIFDVDNQIQYDIRYKEEGNDFVFVSGKTIDYNNNEEEKAIDLEKVNSILNEVCERYIVDYKMESSY